MFERSRAGAAAFILGSPLDKSSNAINKNSASSVRRTTVLRSIEAHYYMSFRLFRSVCLFLSVAATACQAANYYVTQSGAGSADGSSAANAWSVSAFNASKKPTGGDTVAFSGTITSTVTPGVGGTGNGSSRLTLSFSGATLNTANPRIQVSNINYLNLLGGTFGTASSGTLVSLSGQNHDLTISNWTHTGSTTSTAGFISASYAYNLEVSNNQMDNIRSLIGGDTIYNHDLVIKNNYARTSLNTTDQTDIIVFGDAYNVTIQGNKLIQRTEGNANTRHNDIIQCYQKGGSNAGSPTNWTICYNWIELDVASGSGDNSWMMMEAMSGDPAAKIYDNVFVGKPNTAGNNGVNPNSNNSNAVFYFYNNTVAPEGGPQNVIRPQAPGTWYMQNNAGEAPSTMGGTFVGAIGMTMGGTWDYNVFYNFTDASSKTAGSHGSTNVDPQFNSYSGFDFTPRAGSPLIGKGNSGLGSQYAQGIAPGATWPNPALVQRPAGAWDIGAYQTSGSATVVPPSNVKTVPTVK